MGEDYIYRKNWSKEENQLFLEVYPHYTNEEIIKKFFANETLKSLVEKAYILGKVNKTKNTRDRIYKLISERNSGEKSPLYGKKLSEETKMKISVAKKGKYQGENNYWFGKKRSEKQREQMSQHQRLKGKWAGDKNPRHINPLRGELNGRWEGGIKPLYHELRDSTVKWKEESMKKCKYKCIVTNDWFNNIHHLYSFKKIANETFVNINLPILKTIGEYTQEEKKLIYKEIEDIVRGHDNYSSMVD